MADDDGLTISNEPEETGGLQPLVTELLPITDQVGRHVMNALHEPGAVAVLTTIVTGITSDRVVSVALTPEQMAGVQAVLESIEQEDEETAADEHRCIGFQCRLPAEGDA
jgi:hypothetical protein